MDLLLYQVEGVDTVDGKVAALPGVPRRLFAYEEVRSLQQGSEIYLRLPNGVRIQTTIADYHIRCTTMPPTNEETDSARIVLVLPSDVLCEQVPIGTEILLRCPSCAK